MEDIYLRLELEHIDGPRRDGEALGEAALVVVAGETLELLTHEAFPVRSRYLVNDAEVIRTDQLPVATAAADAREVRAARCLELARAIRKRANTPAEYGGEHQAAQSQLAGMGAELADLVLGAPADTAGAA